MAKNNQAIFIIVAIIALIAFSGTLDKKEAGTGVERSMPTTVAPGQNVDITLETGRSSFAAIIIETIPSGWTHVSGGKVTGNLVESFLTHAFSPSFTYTLRAPSTEGTYTFSGTYEFTEEAVQTITGVTQITVQAGCTPSAWTPDSSQYCPDQTVTQSNGCTTQTVQGTKTVTAGTWSSWSSWSTCSAECGSGTQTRTRTCTTGQCGGACTGSNTESQACNTQACEVAPTCSDGIQNQQETGIDCGGPCAACQVAATCNDGLQNQGETGIDCGGPCNACPTNGGDAGDGCEFYEEIDDQGNCAVAQWVWIGGGILAVLMIFSLIK